jgi:type III secretion system YscQ/HrcQ family protein
VPTVEPYPWDQLERLQGAPVAASRAARRVVGPLRLHRFCGALGALVAAEVELVGRRRSVRTRAEAFSGDGVQLDLETAEGTSLALWMEAALADALVARLVRREPVVARPDATVDPPMRGALTALAVETLRRAGSATVTHPSGSPPPATPGAVLRGTLTLDRVPYRVGAWVGTDGAPAHQTPGTQLDWLGQTPIALCLIGAHATLDRAEVAALGAGDVVLPARWLAEITASGGVFRPGGGALHLWPRGSTLCWEVRGSPDGRLVLTGDVTEAFPPPQTREQSMPESDESLAEAVLATPVSVQIEIGSVQLPARDWAALGPGDVLATDVHLGDQVTLRVGGLEIARGDLVSVDGKVGVRIQRMTTTPSAPEPA